MTQVSRIPGALDALMASWTNGLAPVPVYDGPTLSSSFVDSVYLGYDADPLGERQAATSVTQWAGIGAKKRGETIVIAGSVVCVSGDGLPKDARDRAYTILAAAETLLRADPSLGQTPTPFIAAISGSQLYYEWLETAGLQVRLAFTIDIETRI